MTRKQVIALTVTIVAVAAVVAVAWAVDYAARRTEAVETYRVSVVKDGEVLREFDVDELRDLGMRRVVMDGQLQAGPTLLSVLESSGVEEFGYVTILGMGVRDSGRIQLDAADIDQDVLLDFAVRGTAKLCGPNIAWEDRVRDVERIEVR